MAEAMLDILRKQHLCVLCTSHQEEPHCSLMSYAVSDDCREMYMLTSAETRKYANLRHNARVSLLVDTRESSCGGDLSQTSALTISGEYRPFASQAESDTALKILLTRHPHLLDLSKTSESRIIRITLRSFLFLQGINESYYEEID